MAAESSRVPVLLWLPGATEPVEAAGITVTAGGNHLKKQAHKFLNLWASVSQLMGLSTPPCR